jgi:hypothetical protein
VPITGRFYHRPADVAVDRPAESCDSHGGTQDMAERYAPARRFPRHLVEVPVTIVDRTGRSTGSILFDTLDLSIGGAFVCSEILLEVDEGFEIEFALGERSVRAKARVVRVARQDPTGMGIEFVALDDGDREAVRAFLAKRG